MNTDLAPPRSPAHRRFPPSAAMLPLRAALLALVPALLLAATGIAGAQTPPVCDRTPQVRDAILSELELDNCANAATNELSFIEEIDLSGELVTNGVVTPLKSGDLAGLTGMYYLYLENNDLSELPRNIFNGLSNLEELYLQGNELSALPQNIFSGLGNLIELNLENNELRALPGDIFSGLSSLTELDLAGNQLTSLPNGLFEGLVFLDNVYLTQAGDRTLQFNVELIRAVDGNGAFFRIREGTPADIILVLTVSVEDDSVDDFNIESVFAAGNTIQELSGALLRDGDEPDEGVAAGKTVTVTLAADESVELEISSSNTMEGFNIAVAAQSVTITVPADGDTVEFPDFAVDANKDERVDANDALILYYAYSLRSSLGNGR